MTKRELASLPEKVRVATEAGKAVADECKGARGSANLDRVVIPLRGLRSSQIMELPGEVYPASTYHQRGCTCRHRSLAPAIGGTPTLAS